MDKEYKHVENRRERESGEKGAELLKLRTSMSKERLNKREWLFSCRRRGGTVR